MTFHKIDAEYKNAVEVVCRNLDCAEDEISPYAYDAVAELCEDMGWSGSLKNRILDLVPCHEDDEFCENLPAVQIDGKWVEDES